MSVFEVKDQHGSPTLFMDGQPTFTTIYLTVRNLRNPPIAWQGDPYFEQFRDAGFHYYSIELPTRFDDAYDPATGGFKPEAFQRLDELKRYIELDPQAKFLLRVGIEPRGEDSAWLRQHPDQWEISGAPRKGHLPNAILCFQRLATRCRRIHPHVDRLSLLAWAGQEHPGLPHLRRR